MALPFPPDPVLLDSRDTDIVIPVMGPTKAGKSSFLNQLLQETDLASNLFQVGDKLASCTKIISSRALTKVPQEYSALNQTLDGRRIVLVDTPGFDDTYEDDEVILRRISAWLSASYKQHMLVGGVLYLHDISRDGFPESSLKNLNLFAKLCGDDAMERVAFVTTKWDRLKDTGEGMDRVTELRSDFWGEMIKLRASVAHVQPASVGRRLSRHHRRPWQIIHNIILSSAAEDISRRILRIQDEVVNRRRFLAETDAGRELRRSLERMLEIAKALRREEGEDAKSHGKATADSLRERQDEIDRLTHQLKTMELPGLQTRAKRWILLRLRD